jgi:energy-coupling factor transporter ATP-binding protein EcfA2
VASNPTDAAAPHDEDPLGPNNPFPGLRPYRECDADWFFGRDQEINDLLRKLRHAHFLAVVGPSGCGKSSLIRAGVLRSLHDGFLNAEWSVAEFRPGGGPIQELSKALATALGRNLEPAALRRGPGAIVDTVRAAGLSERVRVLIFADQFEELFRYEDDGGQAAREETKAFLKLLLAAAISDEAPIYVAITMRMEYLKRCAGYLGFAEAINEGVYLVPQMTRRQFRQAIVNPIGKAGAAITAALIDRLLNDLDGQTDQLPVLEHALLRMWGPEENRRALDLPQYKAIGTLSDCLSQHVGKVYQDLPPEQRLLTERLFRSITEVTPENQRIRRPRTLDKVCRMLHTDIESVWPVVEAFTAAGRHFLVTSPAPPPTESTVIDISHEALLRQWTTLREWLDTEAELRLEKRSVEDAAAGWIKQRSGGFWRRVFKSPSFLYRGLNLKLALRTEPFLSDDGRRFLKACRRNRFWRRLATGSVVAAVLVAAAWIGGNYRSERLLIQANIKLVHQRDQHQE